MTRKHFQRLAEALKAIKPEVNTDNRDNYQLWYRAVLAIACVCQQDNPLFDPDKFITACGYQYHK